MGRSQEKPSILGFALEILRAYQDPCQGAAENKREAVKEERCDMKSEKYVLPCLPYLFAFCLSLQNRHSLPSHGWGKFQRGKLFGMVKTIGPVFQSYAPGYHGLVAGRAFEPWGAVLQYSPRP